ncbi:MAG: saccharopine dehydrogenase [Deltaproteobacteria bacterium]|nr:MAG: saccharopine dehydrogenase [Deltaproteobacteria bacterium]
MPHAVILGAGRVGAAMVRDLAADPAYDVTVVDARSEAVERFSGDARIEARTADVADPGAIGRAVAHADVVVGALPSAIGLQTLRAVIDAGKPYVDISFMAEDPLVETPRAERQGVVAVVDCGIAPGVSNMMAGWAAAKLDRCDRIDIYVGGLPVERRWPFEYKAGFAPSDVIEEYVRPARVVEHGQVVVKEALSEPELIDFPSVGTLEAFNTDGLRSLTQTLPVPNMREKTLRYPGHVALMRAFRTTGLFSKQPIDVGGVAVRPLDVTSALLFPKWAYEDREPDLTVLRVIARGVADGAAVEYRWHLHDVYDPDTDTRSMSRTTAYPATAVARMIAEGRFPLGPGVYPPEIPAQQPGFLDEVLAALDARGVRCVATVVERA